MSCLLFAAFMLIGMAAVYADGPPAVEVHGWSLTRYYADTTVFATRDGTGIVADEEEDSHVEWERFSLSAKAQMEGGRSAYAEVYIHPWLPNSDPSFLYLESLYVDFPQNDETTIRIGKGRSTAFGIVPGYGNRKTSNYGPLAETFTMDRALGLQVMHKDGPNSLNVALFESQRPGARLIGMAADSQLDGGAVGVTTVPHLVNRDTPADRSGELELSARYGRQVGDINVGLSGRGGAMDNADAAFLASKFADYNGTNKTRLYYGLDATYKTMPWYVTGEYYGGTLGGLRQSGYAIVVGVEPTAECTGVWRELSGACKGLFVRYTDLNIGVDPEVNNPYTWDTQQWAVSYVLPLKVINANIPYFKWLQFEYERNTEDVPSGADENPNDVFFVELFGAF
ncbi:MAG: hypothetical protein JXA57_01935 [Armatimonadetes bacterium]|nr:hypothetical protein [Armatimonadota bacterium]